MPTVNKYHDIFLIYTESYKKVCENSSEFEVLLPD